MNVKNCCHIKKVVLIPNSKLLSINTILNGALTGRPYPFLIRIWEHLYKNTIDCCDGFGQSVRAGTAYKNLRRLIPNLVNNCEDTPWINDRTRFSFESIPYVCPIEPSMFIDKEKEQNKAKASSKLMQSIVLSFYFFDHFNNHSVKIRSFVMIFGTNSSLELLSLLLFTFFKYSFLMFKVSETLTQRNDLEANFQLNTSTKDLNNLLRADLCLLVGVNTRYEGSYLNLKLRKRYLINDFNILSLNALLDLTFPVLTVGSTSSVLGSTIEGNSLLTQNFKSANYPMIILNSNYFKRFDSKSLINFVQILKLFSYFSFKKWNGLNVLNFSLNDVGANTLNRFSVVKPIDLINYDVIYFFKSPLFIFSIKKFIELKTLNFLNFETRDKSKKTKVSTISDFSELKEIHTKIASLETIIFQTSIVQNNSWIKKKLEKNNSAAQNYFIVSTQNFYNSTETYINTEGIVKKSASVLASSSDLKDDWKFLRKVYRHTKENIVFTKDIKNNKKVVFRSKNLTNFKNYLAFNLIPIKVYTRRLFFQLLENKTFTIKATNFFFFLNKNFSSKILLWLQDFYLGNRDLYSRHSKTMVKCSLYTRLSKLNFFIGLQNQ